MLRVIIKINGALAAAALALLWAAGPARGQGEGDLRRAVGLLDYVAGDYGRAVSPQGVVLSESEFEEQRGFVREAAREVRTATGAEIDCSPNAPPRLSSRGCRSWRRS